MGDMKTRHGCGLFRHRASEYKGDMCRTEQQEPVLGSSPPLTRQERLDLSQQITAAMDRFEQDRLDLLQQITAAMDQTERIIEEIESTRTPRQATGITR